MSGGVASGVHSTSDADLWCDETILDPYPVYRELRSLPGPVWLERFGMFVLSRYADVRQALDNWQTFSSAHGSMMNDKMNTLAQNTVLCSDPPKHEVLRKVVSAPLHPSELRLLQDRIFDEAEVLVERLVEQRSFDAVGDLASHLPLAIVSNLVGLPEDGRERMLTWAQANFNCIGPMNERTRESFPILEEAFAYQADPGLRARLKPGAWASRLFDAADSGAVTYEEAGKLVGDYWAPSLDTTILALSSAIRLFGENPDQWDLVREDPRLITHAINEVVRIESPIQGFSRFVTEDVEVDGVTVPEGSRTVVLFASANRDERKWDRPDVFDVQRRPSDHVGFGAGEHRCLGLPLATLEMRAVLTALSKRVTRFELGAAQPLKNNVLHGLSRLDVTVH